MAVSEAIWERPPDSLDDGCARRARIDGEGAYQPGQHAARADPGEVTAYIVGLSFIGRERARHRRRLHDADHSDHEGQLYHAAEFANVGQGRQGKRGSVTERAPSRLTPVALEMEKGHGETRAD